MEDKLDYSKSPKVCSIQIVDTCFMKCKMCYYWQNIKDPGEQDQKLSIEDWESFLDSLKEIVPDGTPVNFTGTGEPLAREGILGLIQYAAKSGFLVNMPTNGYMVDEDMVKRLSDAGVYGIGVSLDSLNPLIHDFLRGVEGTYDRVMKAIGYLRKNKIGFSFMTTIMGENLSGIIDLTKWVAQEKIGIRFQAISRPFYKNLDNKWYKNEEWKFLWPKETVEVVEVINELIRLKESGYEILNPTGQLEIFKAYFENPEKPYRLRKCNVGDYLMNMDILGNVNPCSAIGVWGNIRETHIKDIWFSQRAQRFREKIYNCQNPCHHLINCFFEEENLISDF